MQIGLRLVLEPVGQWSVVEAALTAQQPLPSALQALGRIISVRARTSVCVFDSSVCISYVGQEA
jgi:hypothetical protein